MWRSREVQKPAKFVLWTGIVPAVIEIEWSAAYFFSDSYPLLQLVLTSRYCVQYIENIFNDEYIELQYWFF